MRNVEGAKAGSNQKKPYRAPVSATSTQRMRIKYGISEGTIRGFSTEFNHNEMLKRIYLDGTPIMSAEGEQLLDVVVEFRDGSRDQEPINGLPSISVEHEVGVEVKIAAPVSRSFNRSDTTSYDVRISVPTLYQGNDEGDSKKGLIQFKIDISTDGGAFEEAGRFEIYEKILNGFAETYNVVVPKGSNHVVRISRLNSEVVSDYSVNRLVVEAITENTDVRLRYTNTAVLYLEYDAEQFSNVPKLEMRVFGKNDILVPANYNGDTHTYVTSGAGTTNGVWDGTWKRAYTDNPVWISLDLMISRRYGLGDKIDLTFINKWELYGLAQYCDEPVADGKGGFEPRFTCNNMYLQKSEDAYRVLKDLAASFRAKVVWDGEFITLQADVPRDPVHTFSNANASDITYSSTQDSAQRNLINVQYYDRDNKFASDVVMQRSNSNILSRGKVVDGNFTALGCASQGQAQRIASYVMNTELYETELVSFTTGLEGGLVRLNDVIQMADNSVAGQTVGGRIAAVNGRSITLDRKIPDNVQAIATTQLSINRQDVKNEPISIVSISDDRMTAVLASDAPAGTEAGLVWALLTQDLVPQKFVVTDIEFDSTNMTFALSAIQYNESKYAAIDGSARIVVPPISVTEYKMLKAPIIVIASYLTRIIQDAVVCDIDVSWAQSTNAVQYQLEMQKAGSDWRIVGRFMSLATTLDNMYTGTYTFRVCAYDSLGNASQYTYSDPILVAGKVLPPPMLTQYNVIGILFGYQHKWTYPAHTEDSRAVRLRFTTTDPVASPVQEWQYVDVAYPTANFTEQDVTAHLRTWFSAAIVDKYGNVGAYTAWLSVVPSSNPAQVLDLLDGQLTAQQLDQDLTNKIAIGAEAALAAESAQNAADAAAQAATNAQAAADQVQAQVTTTTTELRGLLDVTADGLTQEILDRQEGDADVVGQLTTYKTSNDAAMSAVQQQAEAATSASSANATALTNLNTEVAAAHNLASNALQQAQSATDATSTNASNLIALSSRMATAEQDINGIETTKLDASVIQQYRTAADQDTATASSLTALRAQLATGARNFVRNTKEPAQGIYWLYQRPLTEKLTGVFTISFDVEALDDTPASGSVAGVGFNMGTDGEGGFNYVWFPNLAMKGHLTHTLTLDSGDFTHFGIYANNYVKITNVMVQRGDVDYPWAAAPEDNEAAIDANAAAIRNTETAIATVNGKVNAQATDILNLDTGLTNLSNSKLDASVIANYYTKGQVDSKATEIAAGKVEEFKASLSVGGTNLLAKSKMTNGYVDAYTGADGTNTTHLRFKTPEVLGTHRTVIFSTANPSAGLNVYPFVDTTYKGRIILTQGVPYTFNSDVTSFKVEGGHVTGGDIENIENYKMQLEYGTIPTDWSPAPEDIASAAALSSLDTKVTDIDGVVSSQANQLTSLSAKLNERKMYQLYSGGLESATGGMGWLRGFDPNSYYGIGRSYGLVVFNGDGSIQSVNSYDVFGGHTQGFIDSVAAVPNGTYVAVLTSDEPQSNSVHIKEALKSLGGSDAIDQLVDRGAYLLVGRKGLPTGQAIEKISNTRTFGVDYLLEMYNGVPIGLGGSSPQSDIVSNMRTEVSNIGGNITSLSETVTQHTASLTNLSLGGFNLLYNGDFSTNSYSGWNFTAHITPAENIAVLNRNGGGLSDWALDADPSRTLVINTQGAYPVDGPQYIDTYQKIAVSGDSFYQLSAYVAPHRSKAIVYATFFNHLSEIIGYSTVGVEPNSVCSQPDAGSLGGKLLQNYRRIYVNTKTPPDTAYLYFNIRFVSFAGAYLFMTRTMCCQVSALNAPLMPWNEGSSAAANVASTSLAKVTEVNGKVTALAVETNTLSTTVGNNTASIQLQQSSINGLEAKATLQVEAGGVVGGVALGNNGGVVDVLIRANTFAIAPPVSAGAGDAGKYMFQYRATPVTLPNGHVSPAGAYLGRASIDYIDATQIYVESLSAISANLGTITTIGPDNSKRVMTGGSDKMFYPSGRLAIYIGL